MKNRLILLRGLPGAGKSTLAEIILCAIRMQNWFEADMFFEHTGEYKFDPAKLPAAHGWCQLKTETAMQDHMEMIVVSNTFTTEKEMKPYLEMATRHGYTVVSIVVENRHGNKSIHGVPEETMTKMEARFQVKLK